MIKKILGMKITLWIQQNAILRNMTKKVSKEHFGSSWNENYSIVGTTCHFGHMSKKFT